METNSLSELLHVVGMTFGVGILLGASLLLVHFFTRHMKDMLHRIVILAIATFSIGILWHILHPIIHHELKKIDLYIDSFIWIFTFFIGAYLVNKLIDQYVWKKIYIDVRKGETLSTSFLRSIVAGLVYATFTLLIMLFVFKKELHLLTTLIGGSTLIFLFLNLNSYLIWHLKIGIRIMLKSILKIAMDIVWLFPFRY